MTDVCGPYYKSTPRLSFHQSHRSYSTVQQRLNSFSQWPTGHPLSPEALAKSGLYYTGRGDAVICFSCNGGLKDWEVTDDPWVEHALWFPACPFLTIEKGGEFIRSVCETRYEQQLTEASSVAAASSASTQTLSGPASETKCQQQVSEDSGYTSPVEDVAVAKTEEQPSFFSVNLCIICCDNERSVVFLPCGHLIACGTCAIQFKTCPTCRSEITSLIKAFL